MAQPFNAIEEARDRIVNTTLIAIVFLGFLALAASLLRAGSIGWQPVMSFQIVWWAIISGAAVFRHRLPFLVRAWILIGMLLVLGLSSLVAFGLIGMGVPALLMTTVLTTLLFGSRVGWAVVGVSLTMIALVGVGASQGWISFEFDADVYATAPASWGVAVFASLWALGTCVLGPSWIHGALRDSLHKLEERTRELHGAIEEAESANRVKTESLANMSRAEEALREREALLTHAQQVAKVGYWVWYDAKISAWALTGGKSDKRPLLSDQFREIFGIPDSEACHATREVHPDDRVRCLEALRKADECHETYNLEYRIVGDDGNIRFVHEIGEPKPDPETGQRMWLGVVQDITELKQAEEQFRQAQKMEAVGQLTAGVAHDFNNMLAVTWGNAELLEDEIGKDNPQLAAVFRATKRAADLTQRLLAFSRKQVLNPEIINANNLIADITGLLRRTLEEHIDIEAVTGAGLWNCEVDPAQLENALVNLAINARDAMPDGGKLTIETANVRLDDDTAAAQAEVTLGQYVMLAVTDTGSGMPPEVLGRIFEPFFTTKDVGKGTGLGLAMIFGFVKQSGGHVTVTSEEGEGTTFKLYLPRSTKTEATKKKPVTDEAPLARGETVLVVEDDPDLRTLAVALLDNLGYQVMEAATGPAALEQLGSTTGVDFLLLTDVVLPGGMSGRELAAEAERRAPGIQVLYMSGYTEDAILHHGRLDAGAELLQKPFRKADLARAVRKVLDGSSA